MRFTNALLCLTAAAATTALAQEAYAPAPAANVSMTTQVPPANCTSGCTTIVEPCTEDGPVGTGMPPLTTSGTWVMPTAPTPEPSGGPPAYTGAAAAAVKPVVGGLLVAAAGLLPALV